MLSKSPSWSQSSKVDLLLHFSSTLPTLGSSAWLTESECTQEKKLSTFSCHSASQTQLTSTTPSSTHAKQRASTCSKATKMTCSMCSGQATLAPMTSSTWISIRRQITSQAQLNLVARIFCGATWLACVQDSQKTLSSHLILTWSMKSSRHSKLSENATPQPFGS